VKETSVRLSIAACLVEVIKFFNKIIMKYSLKNLFVIVFVAALSACGGGGGGSQQAVEENSSTAEVLVSLSDSQGVARISGDDSVGLIYLPEISTFVSSYNSSSDNNNSSGIASLNPSSFPVISTTTSTETRRGTFTIDGSSINVTALKNNQTSNAFGIYLELPGYADGYMMAGDSVSQIPASGNQSFAGAFTQNARSIIAPGTIGSFSLDVNFSQRTFSLNASTASTSLTGSGVINISNGLFATSNATFGRNGVNYPATVYGNLIGSGASSVIGVFYTNDTSPDYAGTFLGSR
jgi:hypothetical protein